MKIQVINYRTGAVKVFDSEEEEIQPFIYKERYYKSGRVHKPTYRQDGREKNKP
jgi:hypothetical protein